MNCKGTRCAFLCDLHANSAVQFGPIHFQWAQIALYRTKSSACTLPCDPVNAKALCLWPLFKVSNLTFTAGLNCDAFWTQCGKHAQNVGFPHRVPVVEPRLTECTNLKLNFSHKHQGEQKFSYCITWCEHFLGRVRAWKHKQASYSIYQQSPFV